MIPPLFRAQGASLQVLKLNLCNLCGYRNARNMAALTPSFQTLTSLRRLEMMHNDLGNKVGEQGLDFCVSSLLDFMSF